ncbi:MAG: DUF3572 family protein [Alphaproteobacteria bacterium]|nr:DUF3572 family protein [Alphaproteobacteria bacterium]
MKSEHGFARNQAMNLQGAETIAVQALAWLAEEPGRIGGFLAQSGIDPASLRKAAGEPAFLAAILDHLCQNEPDLLTFAANAGLSPMEIDRARLILAGPQGHLDP